MHTFLLQERKRKEIEDSNKNRFAKLAELGGGSGFVQTKAVPSTNLFDPLSPDADKPIGDSTQKAEVGVHVGATTVTYAGVVVDGRPKNPEPKKGRDTSTWTRAPVKPRNNQPRKN